MTPTSTSSETLLLVAFALGALLAVILTILIYQSHLEKLRREQQRELEEATRRRVDQSRSTLKGQVAERMAPHLPGFQYLPSDARFLGNPIDYVVFRGHTDFGTSESGEEDLEIILLEIKDGQSRLSPIQRAIAKCVEEGRVRFELCRVGDDGRVTTQEWRNRGRRN